MTLAEVYVITCENATEMFRAANAGDEKAIYCMFATAAAIRLHHREHKTCLMCEHRFRPGQPPAFAFAIMMPMVVTDANDRAITFPVCRKCYLKHRDNDFADALIHRLNKLWPKAEFVKAHLTLQ